MNRTEIPGAITGSLTVSVQDHGHRATAIRAPLTRWYGPQDTAGDTRQHKYSRAQSDVDRETYSTREFVGVRQQSQNWPRAHILCNDLGAWFIEASRAILVDTLAQFPCTRAESPCRYSSHLPTGGRRMTMLFLFHGKLNKPEGMSNSTYTASRLRLIPSPHPPASALSSARLPAGVSAPLPHGCE